MIYLNFNNLDSGTQEKLLATSRKEIESKYGQDLKRYRGGTGQSYDQILEEETIQNRYKLKFVFKLWSDQK